MHCPDCDKLLETVSCGFCERCPCCAGEWYELPALALHLAPAGGTSQADPGCGLARRSTGAEGAATAVSRSASSHRTRSARRCPVCRAVLRGRRWPSALPGHSVALCPLGHGAWLPAEEKIVLKQAVERASDLLDSQRGYFTFLAVSAARRFRRATRPGRPGGALRRSPLARLFT